jgi:hypothetical protein
LRAVAHRSDEKVRSRVTGSRLWRQVSTTRPLEGRINKETDMNKRLSVTCVAALMLAGSAAGATEIIHLRSGQSGGAPGTPGSPDDIVRFNPWGNPQGPVLGTAFTAADFAATNGGPSAVVVHPPSAWMGGLIDPLTDKDARWINFGISSIHGSPGSALYAVPFWVNTTTITGASISFQGGADEVLGDWFSADGPNLDGFYVNGIPTGYMYQGFNFAYPTTHFQNILGMVQPGQNWLYYYQRDLTGGLSGLIFSATVEIVPSPGASAALAVAGLVACIRRRR